MLDQLKEWLEYPDYHKGVRLYEMLNGAGFMLTMLKTGEDDYNRRKLSENLTDHRDRLQAELTATQAAYPEQLTQTLSGGGLLMDERTQIKERLRMRYDAGITQSEETQAWALRMLDIVDELGDIYGQKDFFHEHGYLPEPVEANPNLSVTDLLKRKLTLRTYVSRYRKECRQLPVQTPQHERAADFLKTYTLELQQVQQQLDALENTLTDVTIPD